MIDWSNEVPEQSKGNSLPIRRTPTGKPLEAIVTSFDLIGCFTHYWRGSTNPCHGENCEPCGEGLPYRWHAYMTAVDFHSNMHMIFECTAISAEFFTAFRDKYHSLRGCHFKATRWNSRPNGRILITTRMADLAERTIPEAPDLKKAMAILWSVPAGDVKTPYYDRQTKMAVITPPKPNGVPK